MKTLLVAVLAALLLAGCGIPRDPESTLDRVRGGTLRVGITESEPWTRLEAGQPGGVEVELVRRFATELVARVEWVDGSEADLIAALEVRELDLVVGGLTADTPWQTKAAITRSYATTRMVVAVPASQPVPDDIAGLRVAVELGSDAAGILEDKTDAISLDIVRDGYKNLKVAVDDLMDKEPTVVGDSRADPLPLWIKNQLMIMDWVKDAEVRVREAGHVFTGEAFVVPVDDEDLVGRIERANQHLLHLDWRLHELVIAPVHEIQRPEPAGEDS